MRTRLTAGAAALLSFAATDAAAQVRASEKASVSQTVDGTTVTVEYYRPVARGREALFGGVVRWGETWTPGANWATTLESDKHIRVNGQPLPKGKYSVWMIPRASEPWTVMLNRTARRFHTNLPDASEEQLRLTVVPDSLPHVEVLTWHVPAVGRDAMTLRMQWGTTSIPLRLTVEPTRRPRLTEADRSRYTGRYRLTVAGRAIELEVAEGDDHLVVRSSERIDQLEREFALIPAGGRHRFNPGEYRTEGGTRVLFDVNAECVLVFEVSGDEGVAVAVQLVDPHGDTVARAEREPGGRW